MSKLDGLESALSFLQGLQPKVAGQLARKILALGADPQPHDSQLLKGYSNLRRVDAGEYRIIYSYDSAADLVTVILVGKRNDDEVYKKLRRMIEG